MRKYRVFVAFATGIFLAATVAGNAFGHTDHAKPAAKPPTATAEPKGPARAAEVEEIEVADVTEVKVPATAEPSILDLVSRFHPLLVHMPIAWLLLLVMVDAATFIFGKPWEKAGLYIGLLTAVSTIPAAVTGLLREQFHTGDAAVRSLIATHKWLAISMSSLVIAAMVLRLMSGGRLEKGNKYGYLALVFGAGGLVALAGHWGGQIVFGADFLKLPF